MEKIIQIRCKSCGKLLFTADHNAGMTTLECMCPRCKQKNTIVLTERNAHLDTASKRGTVIKSPKMIF